MSEVKPLVLENTTRRDALIAIEEKYQKIWAEEHQFEIDAPTFTDAPVSMDVDEMHAKYPKFMATMAYPYMNGVLHAGHCFTLSKVEFSVGYERMLGKRALFPLGFHCTGMPILACADKLKREAEQFGPLFDQNVPAEEPEEPKEVQEKADITKFKAKKSKAQAKKGRGKYQFEIMLQLGIAREEVIKFADASYWLTYFPPLCEKDVTKFGGRVDWRRSTITTDANPYYDAFVRWQMNRMKDLGRIKFGERYTIYSEKDGQACMDHDRQSGEGVTPQEYVGIKIKVLEFAPEAQAEYDAADLDRSKPVYFVAATLRPETMYGQTCCFVSPTIEYGLFDAGDSYYITTERAFKNMSFQKLTPVRGQYKAAATILGSKFIGSKINAPLSVYPELRILPMETVLATKGTGVVTCVPSNSPDDYITTMDLRNKPEYYKIEAEWVANEPYPIMNSPKYGDMTAKFLVEELKIKSPKDALKLKEAKELAYKEDFYNATMTYGKYIGDKVEAAKNNIKQDLIAEGAAFVYNEPENQVVSRSGDDCIVSLEDQWYVDYGEESWKAEALECLKQMRLYAPEVRNSFEAVLEWLKNWAVSRSYGLGTKLPWDPKYLVESLSDSTIYHAFYTISHLLFKDYYGAEVGPLGIKAEEMTDEVFDYIFSHRDDISSGIATDKLQLLRREFEYFYPLDVNISGKDLIPNHLTFFIYTHVTMFGRKQWPRGVRANGHLQLNNAKMSKSTGNFLTLQDIVQKFGADASRIALADAGDTVEDANFDEANANAAILRLYNLKEWSEEITKSELRTGAYESFFDKAFDNEMNHLVAETNKQYELTNYKAALKSGLFDFQTARDYYRDNVEVMHKDLVHKYLTLQVLMLAPIAPHFCDYIYREVLGNTTSIQSARFPESGEISQPLLNSLEYIRTLTRTIRETEGQVTKKKAKFAVDVTKPVKLTVFISDSFPEWQAQYMDVCKQLHELNLLNDMAELRSRVEPKEMKRAMPFITMLKGKLTTTPAEVVFNRNLEFDEAATVQACMEAIQKAAQMVKVTEIQVVSFSNGASEGKDIATGEVVAIEKRTSEIAVPGEPVVSLKNIE